eukprot:SAG22_NODE_443_length_10453_cov_8.799691_2_plen_131_part_00
MVVLLEPLAVDAGDGGSPAAAAAPPLELQLEGETPRVLKNNRARKTIQIGTAGETPKTTREVALTPNSVRRTYGVGLPDMVFDSGIDFPDLPDVARGGGGGGKSSGKKRNKNKNQNRGKAHKGGKPPRSS